MEAFFAAINKHFPLNGPRKPQWSDKFENFNELEEPDDDYDDSEDEFDDFHLDKYLIKNEPNQIETTEVDDDEAESESESETKTSPSSSTIKQKPFRRVVFVDSEDSENDADADIVEIPPVVTKSPLKIGAKQKPKKTVIADSFLQEVQRNRESDLLQINSGPRTRSSQKTSQPKQVSLSELEIDLLKDLVKEPSSVVN